MTLYATPLTAAFEIQRAAIEGGKGVLEAGVELQEGCHDSVVTGLQSQENFQRRLLSMQQVAVHRIARRLERETPGPPNLNRELLEIADEQYAQLYENHDDLYDGLTDELENGSEAWSEVTADTLEVLEEQLNFLLDASEQLEDQSLEAAEQLDEQVALVETRLDELRQHVEGFEELEDLPDVSVP